MNYNWRGLRANEFASGVIEAGSREEAIFKLKNEGVIVTEIDDDAPKQEKQPIKKAKLFGGKKIKEEELLLFTRKFASMIEAGLAIVPALNMLKVQSENPAMTEILQVIVDKVNAGVPLSKVFQDYPELFDTVYISLIKAGEASGSLDVFLRKIAVNIQKRIKIIRALKSALTYPMVLLSVAVLVIAVMMVYVVPVFVEIFGQGGVELPAATRMVMALSDFFRSYQMLVLVVALVAGFKFFRSKIRNDKAFKWKIDKRKLGMPLFGKMIENSIMARLSEVLSNLIAGGVNLIEAMEIARNSIDNEYITDALEKVKRQVYSGHPFAKSLRETEAFPETLCGFVEVGEETGKLNDMLNTISLFYEDEFDNSISQFSQMLEPIMIVFLGGVIGFILVAMYMPIFNMGSAVAG
jgi:type IV pilus assembly protein PilC